MPAINLSNADLKKKKEIIRDDLASRLLCLQTEKTMTITK